MLLRGSKMMVFFSGSKRVSFQVIGVIDFLCHLYPCNKIILYFSATKRPYISLKKMWKIFDLNLWVNGLKIYGFAHFYGQPVSFFETFLVNLVNFLKFILQKPFCRHYLTQAPQENSSITAFFRLKHSFLV